MKLIQDTIQFVSDYWVFFIIALCLINAVSEEIIRGKLHG